MKLAGFLLIVAGWIIVLASVALLNSLAPRTVFVLAGVAVELLGFILVTRSYLALRGRRSDD